MDPSLIEQDEVLRMDAFRRYGVRDLLPESDLDELTGLAGQICETPYALISLVDAQRQWFYGRVGLTVPEPPRDVSFTVHALQTKDLFVVEDALDDPRFVKNPLVTGEPRVRFYAGVPLVTPEGVALGTLCVMDRVPRTLLPLQEQTLRVLGRQVMARLDLHRQRRELEASDRKQRACFRPTRTA